MDPAAVPADPLPPLAGFPFLHAGTGAVIVGPTGRGRSSLVQAGLYDAARLGLHCVYLGAEVDREEFDARASRLAEVRGDDIGEELSEELARVRYLELSSVLVRANSRRGNTPSQGSGKTCRMPRQKRGAHVLGGVPFRAASNRKGRDNLMSNGGIGARAALVLRVLLVFGVLATYPAAAAASVPHYYLNGTSEGNKVPEGLKIPTISFGTLTWTAVAPGKEGPVSCEGAAGGFVENPVGGGAGDGQTSLFIPWNCERPVGCPTGAEVEFPAGSGKKVMEEPAVYPGGELDGVHEKVLGEGFPWPGELTEAVAGKIRAELKGVVWIGACQVNKSKVEGSAPLGDGDGDSPQLVKRNTVCFTTTVSGEATGPLATWEPLTENGSQVGGPLTSKLNFSAFAAGHLLCEGEEGGGISEIITYEGHISGALKTFTYEGQELIDTH